MDLQLSDAISIDLRKITYGSDFVCCFRMAVQRADGYMITFYPALFSGVSSDLLPALVTSNLPIVFLAQGKSGLFPNLTQ